MWITTRLRLISKPGRRLSMVMSNTLTTIAAKLWIIPLRSMMIAVLSIYISIDYWFINTCGKCAGLITRCKILLISGSLRMSTPRVCAVTCGRTVD